MQKYRERVVERVSPPCIHMVPWVTGGLKKIYRDVSSKRRQHLHKCGYYTNKEGEFCPDSSMPLLGWRYRFLEVIGRGQSSILIKAQDTYCNSRQVAIKVLHQHNKRLGCQETECLRKLNAADPDGFSATLRLYTTFSFDDHYCMVFESLQPNALTKYFEGFPPGSERLSGLREVAMRLLQALGFLQHQNVIHADLKPENILLGHGGQFSSVKIVDFGNAIHCVHSELSLYYGDFELQTLLYRAPEVLMGLPFGMEVDVWSLGCILAELHTGTPLFYASDKHSVLTKMVSLLGPLPYDVCVRGKFFSDFSEFCSKAPQKDATLSILRELKCDTVFADFLSRLLRYNPGERMSVSEAAQHHFLAPYLAVKYLQPTTLGGDAVYPRILLTPHQYHHTPCIDPDIRQQRMSSRDLLSTGTSSHDRLTQRIRPNPIHSTGIDLEKPLHTRSKSGEVSPKSKDMVKDVRDGDSYPWSSVGSHQSSQSSASSQSRSRSDAKKRKVQKWSTKEISDFMRKNNSEGGSRAMNVSGESSQEDVGMFSGGESGDKVGSVRKNGPLMSQHTGDRISSQQIGSNVAKIRSGGGSLVNAAISVNRPDVEVIRVKVKEEAKESVGSQSERVSGNKLDSTYVMKHSTQQGPEARPRVAQRTELLCDYNATNQGTVHNHNGTNRLATELTNGEISSKYNQSCVNKVRKRLYMPDTPPNLRKDVWEMKGEGAGVDFLEQKSIHMSGSLLDSSDSDINILEPVPKDVKTMVSKSKNATMNKKEKQKKEKSVPNSQHPPKSVLKDFHAIKSNIKGERDSTEKPKTSVVGERTVEPKIEMETKNVTSSHKIQTVVEKVKMAKMKSQKNSAGKSETLSQAVKQTVQKTNSRSKVSKNVCKREQRLWSDDEDERSGARGYGRVKRRKMRGLGRGVVRDVLASDSDSSGEEERRGRYGVRGHTEKSSTIGRFK